MIIPNYVHSQFINKEGKPTEQWTVFLDQLINEMQINLSNEGFVIPNQPTSNRDIIQTNALVGTLLYDNETDNLYVRRVEDEFTQILLEGEAVENIEGTANQINVTFLPNMVAELSLPNLVIMPGALKVTGAASLDTGLGIIHSNSLGLLSSSLIVNSDITNNTIDLTQKVTNTLPISNGGTGLATLPTNGQLLIGDSATNSYAISTLTAGSGVSITNAAGSITIAATGSGGTVTSVSAGTGLTASPSPITGAGTISLATPVSLANGGTNASLTASNGHLVYSTSSALALLSTANSSILVTDGSGIPSLSTTLPAFTAGGNISAGTTNTYNIGASGIVFANMYATTFNGALNGTATNATNVNITSTSTFATFYPTFVSATSGNNALDVSTLLTYNPASGGSAFMSSPTIVPQAGNSWTVGSSSLYWSGMYANQMIIGNFNYTNAFQVSTSGGSTLFNINTSSPAITVGTSVLPSTTNTYNLGSSGAVYANVYANTLNSSTIVLSDVADGTPGSHSAAAPAPSGSTNYWFIPFDPNNPTNNLGSTSPTPPRSVKILINNLVLTGAASALSMRVATTAGTGVSTSTYTGVSIFGTTSGSGSTNIQPNGSILMQILTGENLTTTAGRPLTGCIDISWYIPGSGNGNISVTATLGVFTGNNTIQISQYRYIDTIANVKSVTGVSLLVPAPSALFSSTCAAEVVMNRL